MLRGTDKTYEERDLGKQSLSVEELKTLLAGRPASDILNTRNEEARQHGWNTKPPPDAELLKAMAHNPNLVRRPILVVGKELVLGFDPARYEELL